jgi:hypothetical protein
VPTISRQFSHYLLEDQIKLIWFVDLADSASLTCCQSFDVCCWVILLLLQLMLEIIDASLLVLEAPGNQIPESPVHSGVVLALLYRCESGQAQGIFGHCHRLIRLHLILEWLLDYLPSCLNLIFSRSRIEPDIVPSDGQSVPVSLQCA